MLSLEALYVSRIAPATAIEQRISIWPPAESLGLWLRRTLLAPWMRWDVEYYVAIASRGYRLDDGTAQFHPLYPWLGRLVGWMLGGDVLAGLLVVSSVAALLSMVALYRLASLDLPATVARRGALFLVLAPVGFILFAPYSESVFLLWSILAVLLARQQRWGLAGAAGALATLTRQQGLFLLVPLAWELGHTVEWQWQVARRRWRDVVGVLLVPAGFVAWILYRGMVLGDVSFDPSVPSTFIYSLLISESSAQVVPVQGFRPPWEIVQVALRSLGTAPGSHTTAIDLVLGGAFLALFVAGGRFLWQLRPSYLLYSAVMLAVSFSYYTGPYYPYMGLPRHCLLAFPLVLPLARMTQNALVRGVVLFVSLLGVAGLVLLFGLGSWVP